MQKLESILIAALFVLATTLCSYAVYDYHSTYTKVFPTCDMTAEYTFKDGFKVTYKR